MITEVQYKFLENQYKDELARDEQLNKKAQIYLTIVSLIVSTVIFKAVDLRNLLASPSSLDITLTILLFVSMLVSFFFICLALYFYEYAVLTPINTLMEEFDRGIGDEEFREERAAEFVVARKSVIRVCRKKALRLQCAMIAMIVSLTASFLLVFFNVMI